MAGRSACWAPARSSRSASRTTRGGWPRAAARPSTSACTRSSDGWSPAASPWNRPSRPSRSVSPAWYTEAVLHELRVENLLLMERAELRLAPGLNVLTGETGAGKTLLAHALDLLLGGRARANVVRPGAAEAYVAGVFELGPEVRRALAARLPEAAEALVLAR